MQNGSDMSFSQPPPISMLFLREDFFCKKIICLLAATFYKIRFNSNPSAHQFREKIWVNVSLFVPLPFLCNRRAARQAQFLALHYTVVASSENFGSTKIIIKKKCQNQFFKSKAVFFYTNCHVITFGVSFELLLFLTSYVKFFEC
jgi:hypothetical protein